MLWAKTEHLQVQKTRKLENYIIGIETLLGIKRTYPWVYTLSGNIMLQSLHPKLLLQSYFVFRHFLFSCHRYIHHGVFCLLMVLKLSNYSIPDTFDIAFLNIPKVDQNGIRLMLSTCDRRAVSNGSPRTWRFPFCQVTTQQIKPKSFDDQCRS